MLLTNAATTMIDAAKIAIASILQSFYLFVN